MRGLSPETFWTIKKHWHKNSTTRLHLVGSFYEIYVKIYLPNDNIIHNKITSYVYPNLLV